jgi:hypothetical protein
MKMVSILFSGGMLWEEYLDMPVIGVKHPFLGAQLLWILDYPPIKRGKHQNPQQKWRCFYRKIYHGKSTVSMDDVPLSGRFSPQRRGDMARSVNRHDLQRALEEAEDSMKMGKPWETVWLDGETMGKHGVSPSG